MKCGLCSALFSHRVSVIRPFGALKTASRRFSPEGGNQPKSKKVGAATPAFSCVTMTFPFSSYSHYITLCRFHFFLSLEREKQEAVKCLFTALSQ